MNKMRKEVVVGVVYGVTLLVVCIALFMHIVPLEMPFSSPDPPVSFEKGWTTEDGATVNTDYLYEHAPQAGVPVTIYKQLPDTFYNDSYLNFNSRNVNFLVKVEDQVIYSFSGTDPLGAGGTEAYFQHVRMDKSYASKTISITVTPAYSDKSCYFDDMVICSVNDYNYYYMQHHGFSFSLSLIIVFVGLLMIVQYFAVPREYHAYNTLALGVASIAVGTWSGIETNLPLLLLGTLTPEVLMVKYVCMYFAPYPLIVFLSSALSHRSKAAEWFIMAANLIAFITFAACCITGVMTLHAGLNIFFALFELMFITGVVISIRSNSLRRRDHTMMHVDKLTVAAIIICAVSLAAFFVAYVIDSRFGADSIGVLRVGFIVMQVILLASFMIRGNVNSRAAAESEAMRKLAYVDALTGIGNRTAFDLACDVLEEESDEDGFDFMLVCFDVDDLKKINDTYGHEFGDKHLVAAARVLQGAFGDIGDVFRVGGDEFSALIRGGEDAMEKYRGALKRLRKLEDLYNEENPDRKLRISCGTCLFSETSNRTMREVSSKADAAMYADKIAHKAA